MKDILNRLDYPQLVTIIESICSHMGIDIEVDNDPGDGKPRIFAAHDTLGTFTVLNLDAPLIRTYHVSCISTEQHRIDFEIDAISPQQAIDFASQRTDGTGQIILPVDATFVETVDEGNWVAVPVV
jgi:hypothetical protein